MSWLATAAAAATETATDAANAKTGAHRAWNPPDSRLLEPSPEIDGAMLCAAGVRRLGSKLASAGGGLVVIAGMLSVSRVSKLG